MKKINLIIFLVFTSLLCTNFVQAYTNSYPCPYPECPFAYVFNDTPIEPSKPIVLLVHGWSNNATNPLKTNTNEVWGELENELIKTKEFSILRIEYFPANLSNEKNAWLIGDTIRQVKEKNNGTKIYVVSHSMGALGVLGYIQNLAIDPISGNRYLYQNDIDKYVIIAGPIYGSYFANLIDRSTTQDYWSQQPLCHDFVENYNLQGNSEATTDLEIGSDFTWKLNNQPINNNIKYLTISGNSNFMKELGTGIGSVYNAFCLSNNLETTDGIVSIGNSNLLSSNSPLVILSAFHLTKCTSILNTPICTGGIETNDESGKIISLFFKDQLNSTTISKIIYINDYSDESYYNPINGDSKGNLPVDVTQKGSIIIQIKGSLINISKVSLKSQQGQIYNLEKNKNTGRWFYINFSSSNSTYKKEIKFTTLLPIGIYDLYINGKKYSGYDPQILPGQVILKEVYIDSSYNCNTLADTNCDSKVDRDELGVAIDKWINNQISRNELGEAIQAWVDG